MAACYSYRTTTSTLDESQLATTVTVNLGKKRFTLTPRSIPTSGGTVSFSPSGGSYDCETPATKVTATASANACFDVRGASSRKVIMDRDRSALFVFDKKTYTLTTAVTPAYADIRVSPTGPYNCGDNTRVKVTVKPWYPSYYLVRWGGHCSGTGCTVTMDRNRSVIAYLAEDCDPNVDCARARADGDVDGDGADDVPALALTVNGAGTVSSTGPPEPPEPGADFDVTLTARWNDATHEFSGWGGDCSGTASTCVLTIDGDKSVTADITALPMDRCAGPSDADCVRAVYRGAPDDHGQVTDIPASELLARGSDGRYVVHPGEQITVVTAAPLPEGVAAFHLDRSPRGAAAAVSEERVVTPVGTIYTFTVAADAADGTIVTFELRAGTAPDADQEPSSADIVVSTTFRVSVPAARE